MEKNWVQRHGESIGVVSAILIIMIGFNWNTSNQFQSIDTRLNILDDRLYCLEKDMGEIKTDLAVVKTVLIMKNILPQELAVNNKEIK